jgi:Fe-S cluster assembly iron-binding protein IscA
MILLSLLTTNGDNNYAKYVLLQLFLENGGCAGTTCRIFFIEIT